MAEITDLRQIQRRVFQLTSFEDGLWDLLLGLIVMFLAIYPVTRELLGPELNLVLFLGALAVLVGAQLLVRRVVSVPRIGQSAPRRTPKVRLLLIIAIVMVLITFGLVVLTIRGADPGVSSGTLSEIASTRGYGVELIVLLVMGGLFSAMGYIFGITRLYVYGWMLGLTYLASVYLEHNAGWTFLLPLAIAAGVILLVGSSLFVRFLHSYPVPVDGS